MEFEYLGPYQIDKLLGRGGMGNVYLGEHSSSGDLVAIKVIASSLADQERFRRRFAAEVETLKRLKHANIVQLIGYGEEEGHLFYSMEYVSGHSLSETLKKNSRIPWDRAIEIAIEVCSALKHAHDFGIIHRDLKPANVMLTDSGQVKLTDFGIAKLFGSSDVTAAGSVLGTADYMPPEQAEGKAVTVRSDLYAVGSLLFAMIAGRSPHAAKSMPEILYNVRYSVPLSLDVLDPETPHELSELVTQLLSKEASQRPPTALVVGNRLQSIQVGMRHRQAKKADPQLDDVSLANEFTSIELVTNDSSSDEFSIADEATSNLDVDKRDAENKRDDVLEKNILANAQTQLAPPQSSLAKDLNDDVVAAGKTRFTVVEEKDRQNAKLSSQHVQDDPETSKWLSVVALVMLLIACLGSILYFTRSPSADRLYAAISTAVESGSDEALIDIEPVIGQFELLYPQDDRMPELAAIKNEIEQQRTVRRLMHRSRLVGSEAEMDPVEQAFLDCVRIEHQDHELAKRKFKAFLTVFSRSERLTDRQKRLIEMAEASLEKLESGQHLTINPATEILNKQIEWAEANLSSEQRQAFHQGILELYSDKPWAASAVAKARKLADDASK